MSLKCLYLIFTIRSIDFFNEFSYMHVNKNPKSYSFVVYVHTWVIVLICTNIDEGQHVKLES